MEPTTTTATTTRKVLQFEQQTCPRCGGSGTYSYCSMYGTTCFKCSGRKRVLTARGRKAATAYEQWLMDTFGVPADQLRAGDIVTIDGRRRTLASVVVDTPESNRGWATTTENGVETRHYYIHLTTTVASDGSRGVFASSRYVRWTPKVWPAALAWAAGRKGVEIVEVAR